MSVEDLSTEESWTIPGTKNEVTGEEDMSIRYRRQIRALVKT